MEKIKYYYNDYVISGDYEDFHANSKICRNKEDIELFIKESIVFLNNTCNFEFGSDDFRKAGIDEDESVMNSIMNTKFTDMKDSQYEIFNIYSFSNLIMYKIEVIRSGNDYIVIFRTPSMSLINNVILKPVYKEVDSEKFDKYMKMDKEDLVYKLLQNDFDSIYN